MNRDLNFARCSRFRGLEESGARGVDFKSALLGREPRYAPDRPFDTLHLKLELKVDFRRRQVEGSCTTSLRAYAAGLKSVEFDAAEMRILGVRVQGRPSRHRHAGG